MPDSSAKRMATLSRGQRWNVAIDEERDNRHFHVRREEVQRHDYRMIDRVVLRHADVESGRDNGRPDVCGDVRHGWHNVIRDISRLVIRCLKAFINANREDRQVVKKERVEMIGVEHYDQIRSRGGELRLLSAE